MIAGLLAPVTMLTQSLDVFAILLGRDSGWAAQRRDDGSIPFGTVARLYAWHTAFGLVLAVSAFLVSPYLLAWMSPVVIGQALAIPLAVWTSSAASGLWLRRAGLLGIPEETTPPPVLAQAVARARELGSATPPEAMQRLRTDARLRAAHERMLPPARRRLDDPLLATGLAKTRRVGHRGGGGGPAQPRRKSRGAGQLSRIAPADADAVGDGGGGAGNGRVESPPLPLHRPPPRARGQSCAAPARTAPAPAGC